ncbi:MAG: glmS-2 [Bacteriovoracaceae bacterium]|nr:glmS-2 [Bacteriovoracaceae bacterium]
MCGIVGYVGFREAPPVVLSGLKRLEYRGYDSAGLASLETRNGVRPHMLLRRAEGKIDNLEKVIALDPITGTISIGHTRWATHGKPSERNAHPQRYKEVVIVHNGIIENYTHLIAELKKHGHVFNSETDSEVIAHLIHFYLETDITFEEACLKTVNRLQGAFAFAAMSTANPKKIVVAKQQCPMVVGLGKNEQFIASDVPALLEYTKDFIFLEDGEIAIIELDRVTIKNFSGKVIRRKPHHVNWSIAVAEKEGFDHFMLKEIYEQPRVLLDTFRGRINARFDGVTFDTLHWKEKVWRDFESLSLVACGTAWHSALIGKYWIEQFARLRVDVDLGSEFRYRDPIVDPKSLFIAISQSGETADTLAATGEMVKKKIKTLSITNTVESSLVRKTKNVIYTHAGPEIAVASTKCFLAQLGVLTLVATRLAEARKTQSKKWISKTLTDIAEIPEKVTRVLKLNDAIKEVAKKYLHFNQYFYLGRGLSYPIALEGALKLKEIAYINTQAYPAGEMKHGPIALISNDWPVVCVAPNDRIIEKTISNIEEVKARGGRLIVIGTEGNKALEKKSDAWIGIPEIREEFTPFLTSVVLQLFAYHMSVLRGCDVDKPKNLAKSVTVE